MDATTALAALKNRLAIKDTSFDTQLNDFAAFAVKRLFPIAQSELDSNVVSITVDNFGEATVALSAIGANVVNVRHAEENSSGAWTKVDSFYVHGTKVVFQGLSTSSSQLRIFALGTFALDTNLPAFLHQAVLWFAMSEFYGYLAGNKSMYNVYMAGGARSVDNMNAEADYYEQKANIYLNDHITLYGAS